MNRSIRKTSLRIAGSIIAIVCGYVLQTWLRPSVEELTIQATLAWNAGEIRQAEKLARSALARSGDGSSARDVLIQVAAHDANPMLHVAVLLSVPEDSSTGPQSRYEAGEVAFRAGYAAVAERCWRDSQRLLPGFAAAHDRLIMLAGIRLDPASLSKILMEKAITFPLQKESIRLLVGAESIALEAASMEGSLRRFVHKDPSDLDSRIALARCLNELDRSTEAERLLEESEQTPATQILLVQTRFLLRQPDAFSELPNAPPVGFEGDYWLLRGIEASRNNQADHAVDCLAKAVMQRPLNRQIRSQYCEVLRLAGNVEENQKQSDHLRVLQELEQTAKNPSTTWNAETVRKLAEQCREVGANSIAELLSKYVNSM